MPYDAICFIRGLEVPLVRLCLSQRLHLTQPLTRAVLQVLEQRLSAVAEIRESEERGATWGQTKCPASMYWTCRYFYPGECYQREPGCDLQNSGIDGG